LGPIAKKIPEGEPANQALYNAAVEEFSKSAPHFSQFIHSSPKVVVCASADSLLLVRC
jgi:hypothetical protein